MVLYCWRCGQCRATLGQWCVLLDLQGDPETSAASDECSWAACVHHTDEQMACPAGIPA